MRVTKNLFAAIAVMLMLATASYAQRGGGWQYLGEAHVDGRTDHDNISVGQQGRFRSLALRVENGPIEFDHVIVHYGNGHTEQLRVRQVIPAGGQTRNIDFRGDRREIVSVELYYGKARRNEGRPVVRLYGRG
jgi:hypothetical protein